MGCSRVTTHILMLSYGTSKWHKHYTQYHDYFSCTDISHNCTDCWIYRYQTGHTPRCFSCLSVCTALILVLPSTAHPMCYVPGAMLFSLFSCHHTQSKNFSYSTVALHMCGVSFRRPGNWNNYLKSQYNISQHFSIYITSEYDRICAPICLTG